LTSKPKAPQTQLAEVLAFRSDKTKPVDEMLATMLPAEVADLAKQAIKQKTQDTAEPSQPESATHQATDILISRCEDLLEEGLTEIKQAAERAYASVKDGRKTWNEFTRKTLLPFVYGKYHRGLAAFDEDRIKSVLDARYGTSVEVRPKASCKLELKLLKLHAGDLKLVKQQFGPMSQAMRRARERNCPPEKFEALIAATPKGYQGLAKEWSDAHKEKPDLDDIQHRYEGLEPKAVYPLDEKSPDKLRDLAGTCYLMYCEIGQRELSVMAVDEETDILKVMQKVLELRHA
jgi:hypothetical protein